MIGLVALAAGLWVALLIAAPWIPGAVSAVFYGLGSFICHQIPERSFHLAGFQLPVCARCLGLYVGVSSGAAAYLWTRTSARRAIQRAMTPHTARRVTAVAAVPTVVTFALEAAGVWFPSNLTRALAGVPLGAAVALVVMSALATLHYDQCVPPRPIAPKPPPPSI